jgi:hypothetical protein
MVAFGCTYSRLLDGRNRVKFLFFNEMSSAETSPEKAGVGGSIPSLATKKSTTYSPSETAFHSISFQKARSAEMRLQNDSRQRWTPEHALILSQG